MANAVTRHKPCLIAASPATSMIRSALLLSLFVCLSPLLAATPADLLLVAADDATLRPVIQRLTGTQVETRGGWTIWRGQLAGKSVVLTRTEGDPLNAVAATTLALRLHPPRLVVVFGVSRAHDPALRAGDCVVSERFAAFDGLQSAMTALGGGSNSLTWTKRPHKMVTAGERETSTEFFVADPTALAIARDLKPAEGRVVGGTLGSAHQVNREADRIAWLREKWKTSTEDGESAHVAGTAALFGVPVIGLRVVDGTPAAATALALSFVEAWK